MKYGKKVRRRYELLDKLFDSVFWSTGMGDGNSWSNIFWNRKDLVKNAGLNANNEKVIQKAYRQMKENLNLNRDQMYLEGYKDGMSNQEMDQEISGIVRINRFVLNDDTPNPSLTDIEHKWQIDGTIQNGMYGQLIPEFQKIFDTYDEAVKVVNTFIDSRCASVDQVVKLSDYGFDCHFENGATALIVIYPIGSEEVIKKLREQVRKQSKKQFY